MQQTEHPRSNLVGMVIEVAGDELVVQDTRRGHIHALNATAAAVWQACDGHHTVEQIACETSIDSAVVELALAQLSDLELLDGPAIATGITRREVVQRLTAAGIAGAIVLPVISSITSQQASAGGQISCVEMDGSCLANEECCNFPSVGCFGGLCLPAG